VCVGMRATEGRKPDGFDSTSVRANHSAIALLTGDASLTGSQRKLVGLSRFELLTPRLSSVCSNQLSYRPSRAFSAFSREATSSAETFDVKEPAQGRFLQNWTGRLGTTCGYQIDLRWSAFARLRINARRRRASARQALERR
jgi:hypothetical protein